MVDRAQHVQLEYSKHLLSAQHVQLEYSKHLLSAQHALLEYSKHLLSGHAAPGHIIPLRAKRVREFIEIRHKKNSPTRLLSTLGCL